MKQEKSSYFRFIFVSVTTLIFFLAIRLPVSSHGSVFSILQQEIAAAADCYIEVTAPADGQFLNSGSPLVSGRADPGVAVSVYIDNALAGVVPAQSDGNWSVPVGPFLDGAHSIYAQAVNFDGSTGTSGTTGFVIDTVPPEVAIEMPTDGSYVNMPVIEGQTEPGLTVNVFIYNRQAQVTSDPLGYWTYFDPSLPDGDHSFYVTAVDKAGNVGVSSERNFVLDTVRPVVMPYISPPEDMTRVALEVYAIVYVKESSPLNPAVLPSAIQVTDSLGGVVYGTVYSAVYLDTTDDTLYYLLKFMPDNLLSPTTTYFAGVNPELADAAGNLVYPRKWSFTTLNTGDADNPHGNYTHNVNTCINCHSPHAADDPKISRPKSDQMQNIDNYCNACHDGTVAPVPRNWLAPHNHDFKESIDGTSGVSACAGCHNPHLTWTAANPNMLQDYYYYRHNDPTNPYIPNSSEEKLCESCHPGEIKRDPRTEYVRYQDKKWHTAAGVPADYGLCLRCHDGANAVNIAVYYSGPSRHVVTALDRSPMNGHLACGDCHETHGSQNINMLKSELGHNKTQQLPNLTVWDTASERAFCTGCHNNWTEVYGITVRFDSIIPGHESLSTTPCHQCHGGSPIAAAHAPE
jgi:hypothetical protein